MDTTPPAPPAPPVQPGVLPHVAQIASYVLLIDDDADVQIIVREALAEDGYRVRGAGDGAAALALIDREGTPAVILVDLHIPGVDGAAFIRAYHDQPGPHAPVVVLSAAEPDEVARAAADAPLAGHLSKPFDLDDLCAVVAAHTHRRPDLSSN
jgi:two-component system response regulator MprA